jgi:hypothetical protein
MGIPPIRTTPNRNVFACLIISIGAVLGDMDSDPVLAPPVEDSARKSNLCEVLPPCVCIVAPDAGRDVAGGVAAALSGATGSRRVAGSGSDLVEGGGPEGHGRAQQEAQQGQL